MGGNGSLEAAAERLVAFASRRLAPAAGGGGLVLVWPDGDTAPPTPRPGGGFRLGEDPDSPYRVHFQAEVEGRPMQAVVSGWPFDRVD